MITDISRPDPKCLLNACNADRYGFTHQEMPDNVGIIHMNGRIYDPNLGRFLSVDPVFEFPTNTQSLNPYSYVLNNPLSLTDPTGYTVVNTCSATADTSCLKQGLNTITDSNGKAIASIYIAKPGETVQVTNSQTGQSTTVTAATGGSNTVTTTNGAVTMQSTLGVQNQPKDSAGIGSPAQTGVSSGSTSPQQGHYLNDQELEQFMKMTYSGTQGSDPGVETIYTTDVNGKILIKTQAGCEEAKCDLLNPPPGSAVGGHTHVYPERLRGFLVGQVFDVSEKAAMLARDMPGPGDAAFAGGPGELITPSNAHYSFEGTPQNTIMRYRGGGDANWGRYVQKYWH